VGSSVVIIYEDKLHKRNYKVHSESYWETMGRILLNKTMGRNNGWWLGGLSIPDIFSRLI